MLRSSELFETFEDVPPKGGIRKLKEAEAPERIGAPAGSWTILVPPPQKKKVDVMMWGVKMEAGIDVKIVK